MLEKNFWSAVKKNLPPKSFPTRIENRHGGGVPDVHVVWDCLPFWVELKVSKGKGVNLSPQQIAWNTAYSRCGGVSFILVKGTRSGDLFLFEGSRAAEIGEIGLAASPLYRGRDWTELWDRVRDSWFGDRGSRVGAIGSGVQAQDSPVQGVSMN